MFLIYGRKVSVKVAVVQWLRMEVLGMEVPGSNSGKLFFQHFLHTFFTPW